MVDGNVKKFIFPPVDGGRKLLEKLLMGLRTEEPPSLLPKMIFQYKNGLKQKKSRLNLKKMVKDDKISKNMNKIEGELSKNDLIQVKNIDKKGCKGNRSSNQRNFS